MCAHPTTLLSQLAILSPNWCSGYVMRDEAHITLG